MSILDYQRLDDIIDYFILHPSKKIPLLKLVNKFKVSDRTIRNDINRINDIILKKNTTIRLFRSEGYALSSTSIDCFYNWWNYQKKTDTISSLVTPEDRQEHLIYIFLYQKKSYSLDQLIQKLYISKNTFYSYLKNIRSLFHDYDLKILNRPNIGFEILGTEYDKRQAILSLLIKKNLENYVLGFSKVEYELFKDVDLDLLKDTEKYYLKEYKILESDYFHKNVLSTLALSINRIKNGFLLDKIPIDTPKPLKKVEFSFDSLLNKLETIFNCYFSDKEKKYLYLNLLTNFPKLVDNSYNLIKINTEAKNIVLDLITSIQKNSSYNLLNDTILQENLTAHISSFISLGKYKADRINPILDTIKSSFPLAYDLSLVNLKKIEEKYSLDFSEDEIGYIALHLLSSLERSKKDKIHKLRVAVVCDSGLSMSKLIILKLEKNYPESISIIGSYSYIEIKENGVSNVDLIISTIPLKKSNIPVKTISINNLDRDIVNLKSSIRDYHLNDSYLNELFKSSHFHIIDTPALKSDIISRMCESLVLDNYVPDDFYESVIERENIESTAIDQNIAIPHPMALISKKTIISVAIIPNGVNWGNENYVNFVFLFSVNKQDFEKMDKIYEILLLFLENNTYQQQLLSNSSFNYFIKKMADLFI